LPSVQARISEAKLRVIAEFLERCTLFELPFKAVETFDRIGQIMPRAPIHKAHQIQFAASIHAVFARAQSAELMIAIVRSKSLDLYAGVPADSWGAEGFPWLDEPIAHQKLKEALTDYELTLAANSTSPQDLLDRLRTILRGLDTWHPDPFLPHSMFESTP
jgi:hypothetical protein